MRKLAFLAVMLSLVACGGGGEAPSPEPPDPPTPTGTARAQLGPLAGATVQLYQAGAFASPVAQTTTRSGPTLAQVGQFNFPAAGIEPDAIYVVVVSGGTDHDADDDGNADPSPAVNAGRLHAVLSGAQVLAGGYNVTVLTEALYAHVRQGLAARQPAAAILAELDLRSPNLLRRSLTGPASIDREDVASWDPLAHRGATRAAPAALAAISAAIRAGSPPVAALAALSDAVLFELPTEGWANRFADVADDLLVVGEEHRLDVPGSGGFRFYGVADVDRPRRLGAIQLSGVMVAAREGRRLAYLRYTGESPFDREYAFGVVDFAEPSAPRLLGEVTGVRDPSGVAVAQGRAYYAAHDGLYRFAIGNDALVPRGFARFDAPVLGAPGLAGALAVTATQAVVCGAVDGIVVVDLASMTQVARLAESPLFATTGVAIREQRLFLTDGMALIKRDLSRPEAEDVWHIPDEVGEELRWFGEQLLTGASLLDVSKPGPIRAVHRAARLMGERATFDGAVFFGAERPDAPVMAVPGAAGLPQSVLTRLHPLPGVTHLAAAQDARTVVALTYTGQLFVMQVDDQGVLQAKGDVLTPGATLEAQVLANHAILLQRPGLEDPSLALVDLRQPSAPQLRQIEQPPGRVRVIFVTANRLYVVARDQAGDNLLTYQITASGQLALRHRLPLGMSSVIGSLAAHGPYLYAANVSADGAEGQTIDRALAVFDISTPDRPQFVSSFELSPEPYHPRVDSMSAGGGRIFAPSDSNTAYVIRLTDPLAPAVDHVVPIRTPAGGVEVHGDLGYVPHQPTAVFDLASGALLGEYDIGGLPRTSALLGDLLLLGGSAGIVTLPLADPEEVP